MQARHLTNTKRILIFALDLMGLIILGRVRAVTLFARVRGALKVLKVSLFPPPNKREARQGCC